MKHTVSEIVLKNGARGLLIHIPDATVMGFELSFRAGDYLVDDKKIEAPHLMEHVLLGANEAYPKSMLFQAVMDQNGAYSNASTGLYDITYEAECADFEWDRILELMLLAITKPLFLEDEFESEQGNVREELAARSNNHFRQLTQAMRKQYGFAIKTEQQRLKLMDNVTIDDVRAHYKRTHTSRNMRFVVAGNITPKRHDLIVEQLEHIGLPLGTGRLSLPNERPQSLKKPVFIHNKSVKNIYFCMDSFMRRRLNDDEADALSLVNTMLTETLHSKILGAAREKGLVYGMSSGYGDTTKATNWSFLAQVSQKNVGKLFDIITRELENVFEGRIAAQDIEDAKAYSLGRYQRSAQTVGATAGGYSGRYFFDNVIEDYYQVPKRIKAVTKTAIVDISRQLFADDVWGIGVLGNADKQIVKELYDQVLPLWEHNTPKD